MVCLCVNPWIRCQTKIVLLKTLREKNGRHDIFNSNLFLHSRVEKRLSFNLFTRKSQKPTQTRSSSDVFLYMLFFTSHPCTSKICVVSFRLMVMVIRSWFWVITWCVCEKNGKDTRGWWYCLFLFISNKPFTIKSNIRCV